MVIFIGVSALVLGFERSWALLEVGSRPGDPSDLDESKQALLENAPGSGRLATARSASRLEDVTALDGNRRRTQEEIERSRLDENSSRPFRNGFAGNANFESRPIREVGQFTRLVERVEIARHDHVPPVGLAGDQLGEFAELTSLLRAPSERWTANKTASAARSTSRTRRFRPAER